MMAQDEEMKRLLKKDPNSPSGFSPVGYEYHVSLNEFVPNIQIYHSPKLEWLFETEHAHSIDILNITDGDEPIEHDAFEPGIKVDDEWVFPGDKFKDSDGNIYEIKHTGYEYLFCADEEDELLSHVDLVFYECIGNIHDQEANK